MIISVSLRERADQEGGEWSDRGSGSERKRKENRVGEWWRD